LFFLKQKQSRETWNIGYTRVRKTKQKQSRETWNIGYTRGRKTKQKQSRETWNIGYTRVRKTKQKQSRMVIKTLHSSKLKIEQNEFSLTPGMNSGAPEGWTIPAPLVAPIVLNLG
jgi:hypothetical protein